jgi:carbamoyl-phosphate synthase L subunit-like protein
VGQGNGQAALRAARSPFSALVCCGQDWWHYPAVLAKLHRAGVEVELIAPRRSLTASSRYYARLFAADSTEQMVATLRERIAARHHDWVYVGDEPSLRSLAVHRAEPWAAEIFPIRPDHPEFDVLLDKNALLRLLERIGVPILPGFFADDEATARAGVAELGYPVAIKLREGHGGGGVFRVDDTSQLGPVLERVRDQFPVRIEPWLDRPIGGTQALFAHGELLAATSSLTVDRWPEPTGPSCSRRVFNHPLIEPALRAFGAATGYHGLCHPEWLLLPSGAPAYLELNPRAACLIRHDRYDDVDFASAFAAFTGCAPRRQPVSKPAPRLGPSGSTIYLFPQHLIYCLQSHDFRSLRRWLPFSERHDVPWDDLRPTLGAVRMVAFRAVDEVRAWLRQRGLEV